MNRKIQEIVDQIEDRIINYRRDFHMYPEAGWTEFRTASLIARKLKDLGYQVKLGKEVIREEDRMGLPSREKLEQNYQRALKQGADREFIQALKGGYTGVVGILEAGEGPTVGMRFDIDAVEIEESRKQGHLPYREGFASVNENVMHACGHDGHAAIGLGVAETLMAIKDHIKGRVKLIFQPAEEGVRGAKSMVRAGVVDDVDYLLGLHIGVKALKSGHLICGSDGFLATSKFDAHFTGYPAHAGGSPQKGKNALLAAATAVLNLYAIPRHSEGATRINVGKLVAGTGRNVVPAEAHMVIETRGTTSDLNNYMKQYAEKILENAAKMHDVKLHIKAMGEAESCESDHDLVQRVYQVASRMDEFHHVSNKRESLGGSEDFTYMMKKVQENGGKSTYMMLGSDLKGGHHTAEFDFNEKDLKKAVKLLSILTLEFLKNQAKS